MQAFGGIGDGPGALGGAVGDLQMSRGGGDSTGGCERGQWVSGDSRGDHQQKLGLPPWWTQIQRLATGPGEPVGRPQWQGSSMSTSLPGSV